MNYTDLLTSGMLGDKYVDPRRRISRQLYRSGADTSPIAHPMQGVARLAQTLAGMYGDKMMFDERGRTMDAWNIKQPESFRPGDVASDDVLLEEFMRKPEVKTWLASLSKDGTVEGGLKTFEGTPPQKELFDAARAKKLPGLEGLNLDQMGERPPPSYGERTGIGQWDHTTPELNELLGPISSQPNVESATVLQPDIYGRTEEAVGEPEFDPVELFETLQAQSRGPDVSTQMSDIDWKIQQLLAEGNPGSRNLARRLQMMKLDTDTAAALKKSDRDYAAGIKRGDREFATSQADILHGRGRLGMSPEQIRDEERKQTRLDKRARIKEQLPRSQVYGGKGLPGQVLNILLDMSIDPSDPRYHSAYAEAAAPRVTFDPTTNQTITTTPDMSPYREPTAIDRSLWKGNIYRNPGLLDDPVGKGKWMPGQTPGEYQGEYQVADSSVGKPDITISGDRSRTKEYNEFQSKSGGFYNRMLDANATLDGIFAGPDGIVGTKDDLGKKDVYTNWEFTKDAIPLIGNALTSDNFQMARQAMRNWVTANLRLESGAAIPPLEQEQEFIKWFPIFGDGKAVIKQKAESRKIVEKNMRLQSQGAWEAKFQPTWKEHLKAKQSKALLRFGEGGNVKYPQPDEMPDWEYLSDEDKALYMRSGRQ